MIFNKRKNKNLDCFTDVRNDFSRHAELFSASHDEPSPVLRTLSPRGRGEKWAFTLAEVLITLGIIGVVAALILPTLIGNYKKQEVTSRLKKFYSTFSNALNMSVSENETMNTWEFPEHQNNGEEMEVFVNKYIFPYFQGLKQCGAKDKVCKADLELFNKENAYSRNPVYVFMDGGCFSILKGGGDAQSGMMHIMYDINCNKGPNEYDRDIFAFAISYNTNSSFKFIPGGQHTAMNANNRDKLLEICEENNNTSVNRGSCSALIQFDGWEIKDDYPFKL